MPLDRWVYIIVALGTVVIAIDVWVHNVIDHGKRLKALEEKQESDSKSLRFAMDRANEISSQKMSEMQRRCGEIELSLNTLQERSNPGGRWNR